MFDSRILTRSSFVEDRASKRKVHFRVLEGDRCCPESGKRVTLVTETQSNHKDVAIVLPWWGAPRSGAEIPRNMLITLLPNSLCTIYWVNSGMFVVQVTSDI